MSRNTALSMPSLPATKVYIDPISDFTFLSTAKSGKPWIKKNKPCCALHIEASFELPIEAFSLVVGRADAHEAKHRRNPRRLNRMVYKTPQSVCI